MFSQLAMSHGAARGRRPNPDLLGLGIFLCRQEHQTILVIETTSQIVWKLVKEGNCHPNTQRAEAGGLL